MLAIRRTAILVVLLCGLVLAPPGTQAGTQARSEPSAAAAAAVVASADASGPAALPRLHLQGRIDSAMAARAERQLDQAAGDIDIILDSQGGQLAAAGRIVAAIGRLQARGGRATTRVAGGARCVSACINIFVAGGTRIIHPASHWGFHAAHRGGTIDQAATQAMVDHLARHVPPAFLAVLLETRAFERVQLSVFDGRTLTSAGLGRS